MMWETIRKLRDLLDRREKLQAVALLFLVLLVGLVESSRIASILPLVAVLADPGIVRSNAYVAAAYNWLGFDSTDHFLVFLGLSLFGLLLLTLSISALLTWASTRFMSMRNYSLSRRLFEVYLDKPYEWYLRHNSADLGKSVLSEVAQVVNGSLMPAMNLVTEGVLAACMISILIIADPFLAFFVIAFLICGYWLVYVVARGYLTRIGEQRLAANKERFRVSNEAFGGIKDVKVLGLEPAYLKRFDKPSFRFIDMQVKSTLVGALPQYGFQAVAFGLVLGIVFYQMKVGGDLAKALPIIALYALAGQRLMPALQGVYKASAQLRYSKPALDAIHHALVERPRETTAAEPTSVKPLGLADQIELRGVSYTYPTGSSAAVDNVTLVIKARTVVGFVGETGAGKTTLVDIILGLLEPQSGGLLVDGMSITAGNREQWLRSIGYVPQHVFLSDDTVAANIALGVRPSKIDRDSLQRAAQIANLHLFIEKELPQGYQTVVGERGIRLSGGQRQRISIARALYRDPDLLIMDEGTSALDNLTERAVMDAVNNLASRKTIVMIAHRLSTVRNCDTIYLMERGAVVAHGSYEQLIQRSARFRSMAQG